jgi:hypothetical protein
LIKNRQKTNKIKCEIRQPVVEFNNTYFISSVFVRQQGALCRFDKAESWVILSPIEQRIKAKIEAVGTPLKDWDIQIYRGVLTGFNDAFIITGEKKDELIAADPKSAEIIRPILRGRDIKRYGYDFADLWLINTHNGSKEKGVTPVNIDTYPAIKKHLDKFYPQLKKRADKGDTPYNLRNCAYMDDFYKQKIVWTPVNSEYRFTILKSGMFFNNSLFMITGESLHYICALFNSKLYVFYLNLILSNEYAYGSGNVFGSIPLLKITEEQQQPIVELVESVLSKQNEDTSELQTRIDDMVYELFGFKDDEIAVIQSR